MFDFIVLIFTAMMTSEIYLEMFRDFVSIHLEYGPFNWTWSNVPIWVEHNIQLAENLTEDEAKYAREYVPELGNVFCMYNGSNVFQ